MLCLNTQVQRPWLLTFWGRGIGQRDHTCTMSFRHLDTLVLHQPLMLDLG